MRVEVIGEKEREDRAGTLIVYEAINVRTLTNKTKDEHRNEDRLL